MGLPVSRRVARGKSTPGASTARLRSFPPIADANSRVLVLGTMPGPVALRKREYYGFAGNHFWRIIADLFANGRALDYEEKIALVVSRGIALWDTIAACDRQGAADSAIRDVEPTDIPGLLRRHPAIRAVFLNGGTAAALFEKHWGARIALPRLRMPSTSPANASIPYARKLEAWSAIRSYLDARP
jgi:hypoxanthine-DNA glycosylase